MVRVNTCPDTRALCWRAPRKSRAETDARTGLPADRSAPCSGNASCCSISRSASLASSPTSRLADRQRSQRPPRRRTRRGRGSQNPNPDPDPDANPHMTRRERRFQITSRTRPAASAGCALRVVSTTTRRDCSSSPTTGSCSSACSCRGTAFGRRTGCRSRATSRPAPPPRSSEACNYATAGHAPRAAARSHRRPCGRASRPSGIASRCRTVGSRSRSARGATGSCAG